MSKNLMLRIMAMVLVITTVATVFVACSDKKEKEPDTQQTGGYASDWLIEPSIQAQAIEPLVHAVFNENTNHYDLNFADCFAIMIDGKYGIIDFKGNIVLEAEYDEILAIRDGDDFLAVKYDEDKNREQVYVHSDSFKTQESYKKYNSQKYEYYWDVKKSLPLLVSNENGKITECDLDPILPEVVKGVTSSANRLTPTGKYGLLVNGTSITGLMYTNAGVFNNGLVAFESNGMWGYLDSNGRTVIPFDYDAVWGYSALGGEDTPYESSEGHVTVCKDKKFGILKDDGSVVVPMVYDGATPVVDGKAFVKQNGKWGVISVYGHNDKSDGSGTTSTTSTTTTETTEDTESSTSSSSSTTTTTKTTTTTESTTQSTTSTTTTTTSTTKIQYTTGKYVIITDSVNLRSEPVYNSDLVDTLYKGTTVRVKEIQGNWGRVEYNGKEGWFKLSFAEKS